MFLCLILIVVAFYPQESYENLNVPKYDIKYYDTYLDHFSFRNYNTRFKLRYLISLTNWQPGNAILFFCGNEANIVDSSERSGFVWHLGEQLSAMVVFAEHRYYGKSLPFGNNSFSNATLFGYLSSDQSLADYASLIVYLKHTVVGAQHSAVVAIGGSYGGMLAAWLREKYPNIVAGSLASSAPILMINNVKNCNHAYRILTKSYRIMGSATCVDNIRRLWPMLHNIKNDNGTHNLTTIFRTCQPINDNVDQLVAQITSALFSIGMANHPYANKLEVPMPAWPVTEFCRPLSIKMTKPGQLFNAVFRGIQIFFNYTGQNKCLPLSTTYSIEDTAWFLQTCTELPIPMCTDGITDMFYNNTYNVRDNDSQCISKFKLKPRRGWTETIFRNDNLQAASNIIFSNGMLDPWSAGGIFKSFHDSMHIIRIPSGAHHIDLSSPHPNDLADVRNARRAEEKIIKKWISDWKEKHVVEWSKLTL